MQDCSFWYGTVRDQYSTLHNTYHILWFSNRDDSPEDIDKPLRIQDHNAAQRGLVLGQIPEVDDSSQVMVEYQHGHQVFIDMQRTSQVFELKINTTK